MRLLAACSGLLLFWGSAQAQDVPPPVSDAFVSLFSSYCLEKFPDDEALAAEASAKGVEPMTPAQVGSFLHADPGVGWVVAGQDAEYVLTVEQPPYHACAVRRYSEQPLDGAPLVAAAKAFAAAAGHKLAPPQARQQPIGNNIISAALLFQVTDDKDQPLPEAFMFFMVSYPAVEKPDGTLSKPFWDIRFVRQIHHEKSI